MKKKLISGLFLMLWMALLIAAMVYPQGIFPVDDAEWTITTLTHTVSPDNGFTTSLELEVRIDDFEME